MTWDFDTTQSPDGVSSVCHVLDSGQPVSYSTVIRLWQDEATFREFFRQMLISHGFSAMRWETPAVTRLSLQRPFECVLLDSPWLDVPPNPSPFQSYFNACEDGVVTFSNLGADAELVVPCPRSSTEDYSHLAAFLHSAPLSQQHRLWQEVGRAMQQRISDRPVWLSTAGGGVAWLHVRLDDRPKYYGWAAYR